MWAHLRHLGRRRAQLVRARTASVLRVRDFLSVAWPSVPGACAHPFDSVTWLAALQVVAGRCGADPARLAAMGDEDFAALVRDAVPGWGGKRADRQVARTVFAVLDDPDAVGWSRRGLFRRIADELADLQRARAQAGSVQADMARVLGEELGLARLGDIPGLTVAGAAVILAEAGDPRRYETSKSLVKHAGLSPADHASGAFEGESRISRRGRPALRTAAWRMIFPLLLHNPVMAAKYQAMMAAAESRRARKRRPGPGPGRPSPPAAPSAPPARGHASPAPRRCCAGSASWPSTARTGTP